MDDTEFKVPEFLQNEDVESIHKRMMDELPDTLDKSEGQFPWEFTRPTANEKAEYVSFQLLNAIQSIFPSHTESDVLLDMHAETKGMKRKAAEYSYGKIKLEGIEGTKIPAEFVITTPSDYKTPGVPFRTTKEVTVGESGVVEIPIRAINAGVIGNVAAYKITLMDEPITGVISITNDEATSGGIDAESNESLKMRIAEYNKSQGVSFVGSISDYYRWAMEVSNVGSVKVYDPKDEDDVLTLVLSDAAGDPASTELCQQVYDYIMRPDAPMYRKAPVNAEFKVIPPTTIIISVSAKVELDGTVTIQQVTNEYLQKIKTYHKKGEAEVRYTNVGAIILECAGVVDYTDLLLNNGVANITVQPGEVPVSEYENITFTEAV